jgi:hypothetical protein
MSTSVCISLSSCNWRSSVSQLGLRVALWISHSVVWRGLTHEKLSVLQAEQVTRTIQHRILIARWEKDVKQRRDDFHLEIQGRANFSLKLEIPTQSQSMTKGRMQKLFPNQPSMKNLPHMQSLKVPIVHLWKSLIDRNAHFSHLLVTHLSVGMETELTSISPNQRCSISLSSILTLPKRDWLFSQNSLLDRNGPTNFPSLDFHESHCHSTFYLSFCLYRSRYVIKT